MASKVLATANKINIFTYLSKNGPTHVNKIKEVFGIHERALYDFLDSLVAMGVL
jgi:predicted ArsR family transcriptional regulator